MYVSVRVVRAPMRVVVVGSVKRVRTVLVERGSVV